MRKLYLETLPGNGQGIKPGCFKSVPRSGVNVAKTPNNEAYIFGGVSDADEENLSGIKLSLPERKIRKSLRNVVRMSKWKLLIREMM